jgi:hypothetical protein
MDITAINRTVIQQFRAGGPVDDMDRTQMIVLTTVGRGPGAPIRPPSALSSERATGSWWSQTTLADQTIRTGTSTCRRTHTSQLRPTVKHTTPLRDNCPVKSEIESGRT